VLSLVLVQVAIVQSLVVVRQSSSLLSFCSSNVSSAIFLFSSSPLCASEGGSVFNANVVASGLNLVEACVAIICLFSVLNCDPSVIRRTDATCLPLPPLVDERLRAGQPLDGLPNQEDATRGSYCVRCCVWRLKALHGVAHHCSICQHCVGDFDHHCSFFGRCIAGNVAGWRGNAPYFALLLLMALASPVTTAAAIGAVVHEELGWIIGAGAACLCVTCCGGPCVLANVVVLCFPEIRRRLDPNWPGHLPRLERLEQPPAPADDS
jgi:hypothetical protein